MPANAMSVTKMIIEIATFELYPTEEMNQEMFYFPETEPYNLNFQECGYESQYFLENIGFPLYVMHGFIWLIIISLVLYLVNCICKYSLVSKIINRLGAFLYWNGLIRTYMELYQDLSLTAALNMHVVSWQSPFDWVIVTNKYALTALVIVIALPILLFVPFYCRRRS